MYRTVATTDLQRPPDGNDAYARLNWLLAVNAREARVSSLFRSSKEEDEFLLMRRPIASRRAYALLGLMLGLFPPAAIFIKMFGYGMSGYNQSALLFFICLAMNFVCAGVGYVMGGGLSSAIEKAEQSGWTFMLILLPLLGAAWGAVTGGAGGLIFFGFGAIIGILCAVPVGAAAFALFASLHRLVSRGGMIDACHFWPLGTGVTLVVAALILGL